jgi:hypothetical protein
MTTKIYHIVYRNQETPRTTSVIYTNQHGAVIVRRIFKPH